MNRKVVIGVSLSVAAVLIVGISVMQPQKTADPNIQSSNSTNNKLQVQQVELKNVYRDFTFDADPETAQLFVEKDGVKESASLPLPKETVTQLKKTPEIISWSYPQKQMDIKMEKKDHYVEVSLTSNGASSYEWPKVQGESYMLPIGDGKYIPAGDKIWRNFLTDNNMNFIESFSMRFFAVNHKGYSVLYIADDMYNDTIQFKTEPAIQMSFTHDFPSINSNKSYKFRIYVTDNDPAKISQIYRAYIQEKGEFKTLQQKAEENPNVNKLFGAPHIYLWSSQALTLDNIHWNKLKQSVEGPLFNRIEQLLKQYSDDGSGEFNSVLADISKNDYIDNYQKNTITTGLNTAIKLPQLYTPTLFKDPDDDSKALLNKGIDQLSEQELYTLNKRLLKSVLKDTVDPLEQWGADASTNVLKDMHASGIQKAWIGLPNWADGLQNPAMVEEANQLGYLVGPYDSYHSIQQNASKDWNTASFEDTSLYDNSTIENKNGEKIKGFLGRGRKLNPTLSLPSVKQRVNGILQNNIPFNSWFIDCDATGEIYDDYSSDHPTTEQQDLQARLERMTYISNDKKMVIGSEGGNDFASTTIAFAHGIETPVIQWSDEDMRVNKTSPYYVGGYWSEGGGTPERYAKTVPIKEAYKHIYIDPTYSLPLYKLVYNDSVITTHHWEWGSLKIKDEIGNRMLSELLYNVPPLYHIDQDSWKKNKQMITAYLNIWSPFHEKAVTKLLTIMKFYPRTVLCKALHSETTSVWS
ncbi:lipoprotein [Paenibacillus pini JCM 16418]|uniref:Lipoprotein n=1 Tax=Paenibacillus pini JCM 16418 TaxID=1236976 RepID=W7YX65_9BACL|nr:glycoside hydrolase [Paenibacillus pini]GAF06994.1 lipoprotein [Paenibacillus pini JCM 16418]